MPGKWPDQNLEAGVRVGSGTSRLSYKRAGKSANIDAGLGFISPPFGESQISCISCRVNTRPREDKC
jgi:hypothetical protein